MHALCMRDRYGRQVLYHVSWVQAPWPHHSWHCANGTHSFPVSVSNESKHSMRGLSIIQHLRARRSEKKRETMKSRKQMYNLSCSSEIPLKLYLNLPLNSGSQLICFRTEICIRHPVVTQHSAASFIVQNIYFLNIKHLGPDLLNRAN